MFAGKTIAVTGAASGIGKALCLEAAKLGSVVLAFDNNSESLAQLQEELTSHGYEFVAEQTDVTNYSQLKQSLQTATKGYKLDYFFNNAGIANLGSFVNNTPEQYSQLVAVNLTGVMHGTHAALEIMEAQGHGTIINMASIAGYVPAPFLTTYTATKFGVVGFSKALQEELRQKSSPVRLVVASPGFVKSDMTTKNEFPEWLSFMMNTPVSTARDILKMIKKQRDEIFPGLNGKIMHNLHKLAPKTTVKGSKILLTKSFKDFILKRYQQPD